MTTLLSAKNLSWHIDKCAILQDISLNLQQGELLGIIGPNGAGKSSLLQVLAGISQADNGELTLYDKPYEQFDRRSFAQTLSYLEQDAQVNWPLLTEKVIELGRSPHLSAYGSLSESDRTAVHEAISVTGIRHLTGRSVSSLSQGEKMLVALTRIFATQAYVILADEPIAALDPYHQLLIMELLRAHSKKSGAAAMVVLHDLSLAARFCDQLLLMSAGRIVSTGPPELVLSAENLREFYRILCYSDFSQSVIQPLERL
jgi:ABC-type cobalamin/Fe3+-siderophores transport system ATPase subunit